jgi:hypothetical protein
MPQSLQFISTTFVIIAHPLTIRSRNVSLTVPSSLRT